MGLRIVSGRANAGKTGRVYAHVRDAVASGRRALLLLPTAPDVRRARAELASTVPCGLSIEQFDSHLERRWAARGDGRALVRRAQRTFLARACVDAALGRAAGPGTTGIVEQLVVRCASEAPPRADGPAPDGVAGGLLEAVARYADALERAGLVEPGEAARLLAAEPSADAVAVNRFVDLTPAQEAVVRGWSDAGADVVVALTWDPEIPATATASGLVARLQESGGVVEMVAPPAATQGSPELARLESALFTGGLPVRGQGDVTLGLAQGEEAEAALVARLVREAIDAGTPPGRVAVVYGDPVRHATWLRRALRQQGVDAAADLRVAFAATPIGRALLHLWDAGGGGPQAAASYAAFLRSGYSGVGPEDADAFEAAVRSGRSRAVRPGATACVERLRDDLKRAGRPLDVVKWKELADALLVAGNGGDGPVPGPDARLDAATHRAILGVVGDLAALGDGRATAEDVVAALRSTKVATGDPETLDRVQVVGIGRVRPRRFDVVIVGGLTADELPRRGAADRMEGEAVRLATARLGLAPRDDEAGWERLAFYLVATRARRRLTLVRQEADDEGRATRESVFWEEVLDLYRDPVDEDGAADLPPTVRVRMADTSARAGRGASARAARGDLSGERARALLAAPRVFSASELEAYTACPYRWFVDRALRPASLDSELDNRAAGTIAHDVLAEVYRRLPSALGTTRITPESLDGARSLLADALRERLAKAPAPRSLDEEQLLDEVRADTERSLERDVAFLPGAEPAHVEWSFGAEEGDAADVGGVPVSGRADRIDVGPQGLVVVDYKLGKSAPLAEFEERGLLQLQIYAMVASARLGLPVAGGLYRGLRDTKERGFYLKGLSSPGLVRTDACEPERIEALLEAATAAVRAAAEGIRAGRIEPRPDEKRCERCAWAAACGGGCS